MIDEISVLSQIMSYPRTRHRQGRLMRRLVSCYFLTLSVCHLFTDLAVLYRIFRLFFVYRLFFARGIGGRAQHPSHKSHRFEFRSDLSYSHVLVSHLPN